MSSIRVLLFTCTDCSTVRAIADDANLRTRSQPVPDSIREQCFACRTPHALFQRVKIGYDDDGISIRTIFFTEKT